MLDRKTRLAATSNRNRHILTLGLAVFLIYLVGFAPPSIAQTCTTIDANNGATEATIQSAIASNTCLNLNGTFTFTQALETGSVSNLTINGQNTTTINYACSGCTGIGYPMIQVGKANLTPEPTGVTIENLILNGDDANGTALAGILTTGGSGHTFQGLTIENFPGNATNSSPMGIHLNGPTTCTDNTCTTGTTHSVILRNSISNIGTATPSTTSSVAGIRCSWGSSSNTIQGNTITTTGRDGIAGDHFSTDLTIKHNTVSGTGSCTASCQGHNPPGPALGIELFTGCDRGIVDDNTVDHWISIASSGKCAVRRNMVVNKSTSIVGAIGLEFAGGDAYPATDEIFTTNTVGPSSPNGFGQQQLGVSVSSFSTDTMNPENYAYWANNTIQNMGSEGVQLNAGDSGINYHYFYNNQILNTVEPGSGLRFFGNSNNQSPNLEFVVLDSNTIESNGVGSPCNNGVSGGGNGIIYGTFVDYVSAVNNTIEGNGGDAVGGSTPPVHSDWSNNSVSGNMCLNNSAGNNWTGVGTAAAFTYTAAHLPPQPGDVITFTPSSDSTVQHVMWDFDDGIPNVPGTLLAQPVTHKYNSAGTCHVTLIVWDTSGANGTVVASRSEQTIVVGGGTGNCNNN